MAVVTAHGHLDLSEVDRNVTGRMQIDLVRSQ